MFIFSSSVNFEGAAGRHEEDQSELTSIKRQDRPAAEAGTFLITTHTMDLKKRIDNPVLRMTAGGGQRPAARRIRHGGETQEKPHRDGEVHEPAGEFEPGAAGEESGYGWREGAAGEGAPAASEHPGLGAAEQQSGLRGDQRAAR